MNQSKISVRYAKALFLIAKEKNVLDEVYENIKAVNNTFNESKELREALTNVVISKNVKKNLISKIFNGFNAIVIDFLILLVNKERFSQIFNIIRNFIDLYRKENKILHLTITTADKLSDNMRKSIITKFENNYKSKVELDEKTDKSIIGGIIYQMDHQELNMSVKQQLAGIKEGLYSDDFKKKL